MLRSYGGLRSAILQSSRKPRCLRALGRSRCMMLHSDAKTLEPVRVRFAPSPTGKLHVGGARTALFNWLIARKTNGKFLIRVEDTDEARSSRQSEESILSDIQWMTMQWDEGPMVGGAYGPYRQSERKEIYQTVADKLIAQGKAYRCFCTEDEIAAKRQQAEASGALDYKYDGTWRDASDETIEEHLAKGTPYTVRFRVPSAKQVSIIDVVRGQVTWDAEALVGDFIIMRSNGMPVYNFCVAVDDAKMHITHVLRAEEHLTNTLRQILVLEAMDASAPTYAHCSLILGPDKQKLSKRHGATSLDQFHLQGYLPSAMMNYLANLGWNDGTDQEIYSPQQLIDSFDMSRIVKSSAVFDLTKLRWVNSQHMKALPKDELVDFVLQHTRFIDAENTLLPSECNDNDARKFVKQCVEIALKDMFVIPDATNLARKCLEYQFLETIGGTGTLYSNAAVEKSIPPELQNVTEALVNDYESGTFPVLSSVSIENSSNTEAPSAEEEFIIQWKVYLKRLGQRLELKGKNLFLPVRIALTGRKSGPDIGEQMLLVNIASGIVASRDIVSISQRMSILKQELCYATPKD